MRVVSTEEPVDPVGAPSSSFDAQWSTNALLDADGAVIARFKYQAFGEQVYAAYETDVEGWSTFSTDGWAAPRVYLKT